VEDWDSRLSQTSHGPANWNFSSLARSLFEIGRCSILRKEPCDSDGHFDRNRNRDCHSDRNGDSDGHFDRNRNRDCHSDRNGESDSHFDRRKSGATKKFPLIYGRDGNNYLVVASKGGAPDHPGWSKPACPPRYQDPSIGWLN
jgi:hypothetical protein